MSSPFLGKIKYRKERVAVVERDGKTYVKYVKARRFRVSKNVEYTILSLLILFALGLGFKLLMSEFASREPVAAPTEGIGG